MHAIVCGQVAPDLSDLEAPNNWLEDRYKALWAQKAALMPLPKAFDGIVEQSKRVSPTCLITFDLNRYSVTACFANRPVSLHIYPEQLVIVAKRAVICTHERIIER